MQRFIKQYGERRTGTNLLRAILLRYCSNVTVLMHILGDKHSAPPQQITLNKYPIGTEDILNWIRDTTEQIPAETTNLCDTHQNAYLESISVPLANAIKSEKLHFVISIKDPYAWIVSYLHMTGIRIKGSNIHWQKHSLISYIKDAFSLFNQRYSAWSDLANRYPQRTSTIRHEDLLTNQEQVLLQLQQKHGLQRLPIPFTAIQGIVLPTHWDHQLTEEHHVEFDSNYYSSRAYLTNLPSFIIQTIDECVDWDLMKQFGYSVRSSMDLTHR